jgi:hypothetical protein
MLIAKIKIIEMWTFDDGLSVLERQQLFRKRISH